MCVLYLHGMPFEEMEHRDVAFDVMKQVGHVPEATRRLHWPLPR